MRPSFPDPAFHFPLRPEHVMTHVKKSQEIEVSMWRRASKTCVWYEYAVVQPNPSRIHNFDGWVHKIGC